MKNAQWINSAFGGAIVGAIATMAVGFTFGGWATPLGAEQPNAALATACSNALAKAL